MSLTRPDILFIMTDQQRFDTIAALGNSHIYTPNLDRLVRRGISFSNAYASCPICIPARYTIRTGCEPATTRAFSNAKPKPAAGQTAEMEARCGPYLARTMSRLGYRTFGIGKFHTYPWNEDVGYETLWRSEETYPPPAREGDDYGSWLTKEHPAFDFLEQPFGERTEMYYLPQRSPLPADLGAEWWETVRVCLLPDHGDPLGEHHGWQKHNVFEAASRVPLLLSWPATLSKETVRNELISLADLFGIATEAAGQCDMREGINVLKLLRGECARRQYLVGMVEPPGSHDFKLMVVTDEWKYIFMANGGREQLFNLRQDPNELSNSVASDSKIRNDLHALGVQACQAPGAIDALDGKKLRAFPFRERPRTRIYQFDRSRGVVGFPDRPEDALKSFDPVTSKRAN